MLTLSKLSEVHFIGALNISIRYYARQFSRPTERLATRAQNYNASLKLRPTLVLTRYFTVKRKYTGASFIKAFKTKLCPGRCPRTF